jgi:hypothetical protein
MSIIIMNELTLYQFIQKKIVYLTDRSSENELLLPLLEEYKYLLNKIQERSHSGLHSLESYLSQCSDPKIHRELEKVRSLKISTV